MKVSESNKIAICRTEAGYLVRIAPRGTVQESPAVRDFVCRALGEGIHIVLDLSTCEYLDSTFLGCLVLMHQRGCDSPGSLAVFAEKPVRHRLFATCQLESLLSFAASCPPCNSEPIALRTALLDRRELCEHLIATHRKLAELGGTAADAFRRIAEQLTAELNGLRS